MNEQVTVESIVNKSDENERKIISRLALQKILSSGVTQFIESSKLEEIKRLFISESPEKDLSVSLNFQGSNRYDAIGSLSLKWTQDANEIQDLEGNVWVTHRLEAKGAIGSAYSCNFGKFQERVEALIDLRDLICDIESLAPEPIRTIAFDNEQRIARDTRRRREGFSNIFSLIIKNDRQDLRYNLRTGGRGRLVPRELVQDFDPGKYDIRVDDGAFRRAKNKYYVLTVPSNPSFNAILHRVG